MNNITITYSAGVHHVVTSPLYQGDYGQQITFAGIADLPASFEVHFSNEASKGISTRSIGLDSVVDIPNMYLQTGEVSIYGWVFLHDPATSGETEYTFRIPVKKKPAADPVIPTPPQEDVIAQAINAINGSAEDAAQSATDAQTAQGLAEDARDAAQTAQGLAETAQGKAEDAQEAAETAQGKAETAQGKAEDAQSAAEAQAVLAESYAKGGTNTRTGENTDNAKYYAEQSAGSASTASGYVTDAQGYASDASGYANDAKDYKNAAGDYATEAYGYKNDASGSASEASGYADDAKGYKNDASGYASDASGYASAASGSASSAEAEALKSEGYADGKQNGTNVGSGSPYYHNNSKYYSQLASGFATTAEDAAEDAEAYAKGTRGGTAVESDDPAYHNNSKYYSEQAADSATSAATSAATFETDTTLTVSGKAADAKKAGDEITDLKSHITQLVTGKNEPIYSAVYTGQSSPGYINRDTAAVISHADYEHLELPNSLYGYVISGMYSKNSALTPVVYVDKNGQKVGEDNLADSGNLYTSGYALTFPTGATQALITRHVNKTLTIFQYYNGTDELKSLAGQLVKPTIVQDFTASSVTTVYTTIWCYPGHRYFILAQGSVVNRVGVVVSVWDFYANNKYVYGEPSAAGRVCIGTSGAGTGTVYVFDTTDNDALNAFLVENNVNFASTPYGSFIYNKLLASSGKWYEPLAIGSGSFSGSTAAVHYTNIWPTSGHRYVFIVDGTGIGGIGTVSSAWVEFVHAKVGAFTPDGSYRFAIEYDTNASGDYWAFDTTGNDELHEYLLAASEDYNMTQVDAVTSALSKSVNHERSKYFGKKVVAFGDSITAQKTWFPGVSGYFGAPPLSLGVGGATVTTVGSNGFCTDARVNTIPTGTDLLLIMGGVNDWSQNVAIGDRTLTNADTTTIYGAVNTLVDKLLTRVPNAKIICMGCTFAMAGTQNTHSRSDTLNTLGLSTLDYGKALADAFAMNGIESFVIGEFCGWNSTNISTYVNFDGAYFHPNNVGGARMAEVIVRSVE